MTFTPAAFDPSLFAEYAAFSFRNGAKTNPIAALPLALVEVVDWVSVNAAQISGARVAV